MTVDVTTPSRTFDTAAVKAQFPLLQRTIDGAPLHYLDSANTSQKPVEVIEAGEDKVIAVIRVSGRAKLSGVETDLTYAELWTLRDGKVAWGRQYWTRAEALEAAGLRE